MENNMIQSQNQRSTLVNLKKTLQLGCCILALGVLTSNAVMAGNTGDDDGGAQQSVSSRGPSTEPSKLEHSDESSSSISNASLICSDIEEKSVKKDIDTQKLIEEHVVFQNINVPFMDGSVLKDKHKHYATCTHQKVLAAVISTSEEQESEDAIINDHFHLYLQGSVLPHGTDNITPDWFELKYNIQGGDSDIVSVPHDFPKTIADSTTIENTTGINFTAEISGTPVTIPTAKLGAEYSKTNKTTRVVESFTIKSVTEGPVAGWNFNFKENKSNPKGTSTIRSAIPFIFECIFTINRNEAIRRGGIYVGNNHDGYQIHLDISLDTFWDKKNEHEEKLDRSLRLSSLKDTPVVISIPKKTLYNTLITN